MRALRLVCNTALWLVATLGLVSVLVWGATQAGWIKPLVVISGSMEPGIMTGDLLVARSQPTSELRVGDVATIHSDLTGNLVSHRVVSVEPTDDGRWAVQMKGDANETVDAGTYVVGDTVLRPAVQISGGGYALVALTRPPVAVPLGVALVALLGLSLLPRSPSRPRPESRPAPEPSLVEVAS
ncbi:signal peptidase I [Cellulomonas sp.]|uniref:signal peptidase I n=1 Tax=Cellulomonas sp. TaxID=40001 RepID=UPI001AFED21E|nr:signal peptidase I [Cellulomonas sp.]MBO9556318.1 signal peptidase I [Cellulomonas sp.]